MTNINFINLTPHAINIYLPFCPPQVVTASGQLARVDSQDVWHPSGVVVKSFGAVVGLPAPAPNTVYLVSGLVLSQVSDRSDVFAPGVAIRDDTGRVIGCLGLSGTAAYEAPEDVDVIESAAQALAAVPDEKQNLRGFNPHDFLRTWRRSQVINPLAGAEYEKVRAWDKLVRTRAEEIRNARYTHESRAIQYEARSVNGRWGFDILAHPTVSIGADVVNKGRIYPKGKRDKVTVLEVNHTQRGYYLVGQWEIVSGDSRYLVDRMGLQGHSFGSVINLVDGSVLRKVGYKRRRTELYSFLDGELVEYKGVIE